MSSREHLLAWVTRIYADKLIRLTHTPYIDHLTFVAELVADFAPLAYETGLCHDIIEDFDIDSSELGKVLKDFGYGTADTAIITGTVLELTAVFTAKHFPDLSKKERHQQEDERLVSVNAMAQTVKYADLIYNANWMVQHKPHKAQAYLMRKRRLLEQLTKGDSHLRDRALSEILKLSNNKS